MSFRNKIKCDMKILNFSEHNIIYLSTLNILGAYYDNNTLTYILVSDHF
jgi:hypothetical protein